MNSIAKYLRWLVGLGAAVLLVAIVVNSNTRKNFLSGSNFTTGALIAAIALGVVLTYRGSGVVNFANSAIAMYVAYVYAVLRNKGDLFLPPLPNPFAPIEGIVHKLDKKSTFKLPHWPTSISFGPNMQFWPALLIALVFAVLFGLILHFLIFRPLRTAPPLAKVVASIGLFIYLQAVALRRFGIQPVTVKPVRPELLVPFVLQWAPDRASSAAAADFVEMALDIRPPPGWSTGPAHRRHLERA